MDEEIISVIFPNRKEVMSLWKFPKKSNGKNTMKSRKKIPKNAEILSFIISVISPRIECYKTGKNKNKND